MTTAERAPRQDEAPPQYRLIGPVYVNDRLYDQGEIDRAGEKGIFIFFTGVPNQNMVPVNASAKKMAKDHPIEGTHPIDSLTVVGPGATVLAPNVSA